MRYARRSRGLYRNSSPTNSSGPRSSGQTRMLRSFSSSTKARQPSGMLMLPVPDRPVHRRWHSAASATGAGPLLRGHLGLRLQFALILQRCLQRLHQRRLVGAVLQRVLDCQLVRIRRLEALSAHFHHVVDQRRQLATAITQGVLVVDDRQRLRRRSSSIGAPRLRGSRWPPGSQRPRVRAASLFAQSSPVQLSPRGRGCGGVSLGAVVPGAVVVRG